MYMNQTRTSKGGANENLIKGPNFPMTMGPYKESRGSRNHESGGKKSLSVVKLSESKKRSGRDSVPGKFLVKRVTEHPSGRGKTRDVGVIKT